MITIMVFFSSSINIEEDLVDTGTSMLSKTLALSYMSRQGLEALLDLPKRYMERFLKDYFRELFVAFLAQAFEVWA